MPTPTPTLDIYEKPTYEEIEIPGEVIQEFLAATIVSLETATITRMAEVDMGVRLHLFYPVQSTFYIIANEAPMPQNLDGFSIVDNGGYRISGFENSINLLNVNPQSLYVSEGGRQSIIEMFFYNEVTSLVISIIDAHYKLPISKIDMFARLFIDVATESEIDFFFFFYDFVKKVVGVTVGTVMGSVIGAVPAAILIKMIQSIVSELIEHFDIISRIRNVLCVNQIMPITCTRTFIPRGYVPYIEGMRDYINRPIILAFCGACWSRWVLPRQFELYLSARGVPTFEEIEAMQEEY
jgi:hypothetical protein